MISNNTSIKINTEKHVWIKPTVKTITFEELRKVITVSACSEFNGHCISGFAR